MYARATSVPKQWHVRLDVRRRFLYLYKVPHMGVRLIYHFIIAINVSLLVVCSSMLFVVSISRWRNVWVCARAWESKLSDWESGRKREKAFQGAYRFPGHATGFKRKICFCALQKQKAPTWVLRRIRFRKLFNWPLLFFRQEESLGPYFYNFSAPCGQGQPFRKCRSVNTLSVCQL